MSGAEGLKKVRYNVPHPINGIKWIFSTIITIDDPQGFLLLKELFRHVIYDSYKDQ